MSNKKTQKFICIICPNACEMTVNDKLEVLGAKCKRGVKFALQEIKNPQRIITTTIWYKNKGIAEKIPVKTVNGIDLAEIMRIQKIIKSIVVNKKPQLGEIIEKDGVSLIVTGE